MSNSTMSEEFHDWLNDCPTQWFRLANVGNRASYEFVEEKQDDN